MLQKFASYWWFLTICGLVLTGLGALMVFGDNIGLAEILRYLGFVFIGAGIFIGIVNYLMFKKGHKVDWRWYLFGGIELVLGLIIIFNNEWAEATFIDGVGIATILMGVFMIYEGLRKEVKSLVVSLSGVVSCIFGGIIFFEGAEPANLHYLVGIYGILFGIYLINASIRLRGWSKTHSVNSTPTSSDKE